MEHHSAPTTPEIAALQAQIMDLKSKLAAARRQRPPEPVGDWTLRTTDGAPVAFRDLFGNKRDLIVIHNMGRRCVYCTLWADGLIGYAAHLADRAALVLTSPDEPAVLREFAASRGWPFRCVSIAGTTFARDLGFTPRPTEGKPVKDTDVYPGVSAFTKRDDGSIVRTGWDNFGPGDDYCAVWPLLELLDGGAKGWEPKYSYAPAAPVGITVRAS